MADWVVLDRDGVINVDYVDYVKSLSEWQAIPGSIDAIARLSQAGIKVAVATNQSGLARQRFSIDDLEEIHAELNRLVEEAGGVISGIFYCPHKPEDKCECRKPKPGLLKAIEIEFDDKLGDAPYVGDSLRDLQAGIAMGCTPVLVLTGNGKTTQDAIQGDNQYNDLAIYSDLASFTDHYLSHRNKK